MKVRSLRISIGAIQGKNQIRKTAEKGKIRKVNETTFHIIRELRTRIKMMLTVQERSLYRNSLIVILCDKM